MNSTYKRYRVTLKEKGNDSTLTPEVWGYVTIDDVIKKLGLNEPDIEWYRIEDLDEKENFLKYARVQLEGSLNMYTQASLAARRAGLSMGDYEYIINNYRELRNKYDKEFREIELEILNKLKSK